MLEHLTTEARNPASEHLDSLTPLELVRLINEEDGKCTEAVAEQAEQIAKAIDVIARRLSHGGRLIYIGAGTSGRLGLLDAAECPPTFRSDPSQVIGLIAGGLSAMFKAVEGAEDSPTLAAEDLQKVNLTNHDVVVGIATSGRTPYVIGGMDYARSQGAYTIGLACNRDSLLSSRADVSIIPVVGPEVLSGSTRMKAGTATKMVLNMLTTGAMVLLGKTYGNLMVDMNASNSKLLERAKRIVSVVADVSPEQAASLLDLCNGEVKTAITAYRLGVTPEEARVVLHATNGHLRAALESMGRLNGRSSSGGHATNGIV